MNFGNIFGQIFRDYTGMPTKVSSYNNKLKIYDQISCDISEIEQKAIEYLDVSGDFDWKLNEAKRLKLNYDLSHDVVSPSDYALAIKDLEFEKRYILDAFISSTDLYFITVYRNKLNFVKSRNTRDAYISLMNFDTWFDMEEARELAELAALQIRSSDEYVDAKRIAEIRDKFMYERHLRRGR